MKAMGLGQLRRKQWCLLYHFGDELMATDHKKLPFHLLGDMSRANFGRKLGQRKAVWLVIHNLNRPDQSVALKVPIRHQSLKKAKQRLKGLTEVEEMPKHDHVSTVCFPLVPSINED